jgi:NTE family protein
MTIKHLVISGGGPIGLRFLGVLEKLNIEQYWDPKNTESIYCTSIGSLIATFICLKFDWSTLRKYIIERPWQDVFTIDADQILNSYHSKGLFDRKFFEIILRPLLKAKQLHMNITLEEFYQFSSIDLHIFTFDLNQFQIVELTRQTHPQLELMQALAMSCALPGLFMPVILDNQCFIDGGVMCNYPINQCLRDHPDETEIIGIKMVYQTPNGSQNISINNTSTLLDFIVGFAINSMNYIRDSVQMSAIANTIYCYTDINPLQFEYIQQAITDQDLRRKWIEEGERDVLEMKIH